MEPSRQMQTSGPQLTPSSGCPNTPKDLSWVSNTCDSAFLTYKLSLDRSPRARYPWTENFQSKTGTGHNCIWRIFLAPLALGLQYGGGDVSYFQIATHHRTSYDTTPLRFCFSLTLYSSSRELMPFRHCYHSEKGEALETPPPSMCTTPSALGYLFLSGVSFHPSYLLYVLTGGPEMDF